jgi:hypothetical protein
MLLTDVRFNGCWLESLPHGFCFFLRSWLMVCLTGLKKGNHDIFHLLLMKFMEVIENVYHHLLLQKVSTAT